MTDPNRAGGRLTVLYDARCRVCTRVAGRLAGADRDRRLRLRPLQTASDDEWTSVRVLAADHDLGSALHVIDESGSWASGGEAVLRVLERVPRGAVLARLARLPLLTAVVEPSYRVLASKRAWFSWLAGSFRPTQGIGRR